MRKARPGRPELHVLVVERLAERAALGLRGFADFGRRRQIPGKSGEKEGGYGTIARLKINAKCQFVQ